jgi:hypothetical protein
MATKTRTENVTKYQSDGSGELLVSVHLRGVDGEWMLQDFRGSQITTDYYVTREEAEAHADNIFELTIDLLPAQLWRLTRRSVGYAEVESVLIAADNEQDARLLTVKHYRSASYVAEFLFEDEADATHLGVSVASIPAGTILMEVKSPE